MAIVHVLNSNGNGSAIGDVGVNRANIDPVAKVAGTDSITAADLKKYDWFNVTSSAATDNITIDDDIEIGSSFVLYVGANGMEIVGGGTGKLNNGTTIQVIDIAANCRVEITKHAADAITVEQVTAAGARTAPTPALDG